MVEYWVTEERKLFGYLAFEPIIPLLHHSSYLNGFCLFELFDFFF